MSTGAVMSSLPPRPRSSINLSSMGGGGSGGGGDDEWQVVGGGKKQHGSQQGRMADGLSAGAGAGAPPRPSGRRGSHSLLPSGGGGGGGGSSSKHATPGHSTPATPRRGSASGTTPAHLAAAQAADEQFASFRKGTAFARSSAAANTSDWRRPSLESADSPAGTTHADDAAAATAAHANNGKTKGAGGKAASKRSRGHGTRSPAVLSPSPGVSGRASPMPGGGVAPASVVVHAVGHSRFSLGPSDFPNLSFRRVMWASEKNGTAAAGQRTAAGTAVGTVRGSPAASEPSSPTCGLSPVAPLVVRPTLQYATVLAKGAWHDATTVTADVEEELASINESAGAAAEVCLSPIPPSLLSQDTELDEEIAAVTGASVLSPSESEGGDVDLGATVAAHALEGPSRVPTPVAATIDAMPEPEPEPESKPEPESQQATKAQPQTETKVVPEATKAEPEAPKAKSKKSKSSKSAQRPAAASSLAVQVQEEPATIAAPTATAAAVVADEASATGAGAAAESSAQSKSTPTATPKPKKKKKAATATVAAAAAADETAAASAPAVSAPTPVPAPLEVEPEPEAQEEEEAATAAPATASTPVSASPSSLPVPLVLFGSLLVVLLSLSVLVPPARALLLPLVALLVVAVGAARHPEGRSKVPPAVMHVLDQCGLLASSTAAAHHTQSLPAHTPRRTPKKGKHKSRR